MTAYFACVIVLVMNQAAEVEQRKPGKWLSYYTSLVAVIFALLTILLAGCNRSVGSVIPDTLPTPISVIQIQSTPIPTPTFTLPPTPTPLPSVRIESAEESLFIGDWDTAIREFTSAQELSSDEKITSAAQLGLARTYYYDGNYHQAINLLENLVSANPSSDSVADAYFLLGEAYSALDQHAKAAQAYLQYLERRPGIIDGYVRKMRADSLRAAGEYTAAAEEYQSALNSESLLNKELLEIDQAEALALSGDYLNAINLYDDLSIRTTDSAIKALISLRKAQTYEWMGETDLAFTAYSDTVTNYPTFYSAYLALIELVEAGIAVDELQRGIIDYHAGQYGVALAAFDRYLQNAPADPATAYYFSGLSNRALGGHEEALTQWTKIIEGYPDHPYWDDAYEELAYTRWAILSDYEGAVETLLRFVSIAPTHPRAGEFLYDAGYVSEVAGNLEQAADYWGQTSNLYPEYEKADRALFLEGITEYRLANYTNALGAFQKLALEATILEDRAAAYLWIGKTKLAQGDESGANSSWQQAAGMDPTGYYTERSLDLLHGIEPFEPPVSYDLAIDYESERAQAEDWLRIQFNLPPETVFDHPSLLVNEPGFTRANELWNSGLLNEAVNEFEQLRQKATSDPVMSYQLMNYLLDAGIYRTAIFTARQILDLAGMDDASSLTAPQYFNHVRFGTYYPELVMNYAEQYNFHPLFLYSVIRQESLFESFIRSSAAASGLMQIIPATGEEIARNVGWPADYSQEDLYRPIVNLLYGAEYLDTQRNIFSGDLYTALAAYNGGPGNARLWKVEAPDDPDLFLEIIRFAETREYIRNIYEIFSIYSRIYDRTP